MDTENRKEWYDAAEKWEVDFVDKFGDRFGVIINPSKEKSKFAPDLYVLKKSISADLKVQSMPFFTSEKESDIPPQYCWTFNVCDLFDYSVRYGDKFGIFVWIKYDQELKDYGVTIPAEESVYFTYLFNLKDIIARSEKIHRYIRRVNDTNGNAYGSHMIDLRKLIKIYPNS